MCFEGQNAKLPKILTPNYRKRQKTYKDYIGNHMLRINLIVKYIVYSFDISTIKFNFAANQYNYNVMVTKEEVQRFLNQMKEKIKVFGIIYRDDRGKNAFLSTSQNIL